MKKFFLSTAVCLLFFALSTTSASAVVNDTVKVGLKYGSSALTTANLENAQGSGYAFGYFDDQRQFVSLGSTGQITISMTSEDSWRVQLPGTYASFQAAQSAAAGYSGASPAYISGSFVVRMGAYSSASAAQSAAASVGGTAVSPSSTGVTVIVTGTDTVLFQFDCLGVRSLGVMPQDSSGDPITWFKGYRYHGGFEYQRVTGGAINVINVVSLEDYVKGVLPGEMGSGFPAEALKAQAVCARTYTCRTTKHLSTYGFDVCNTTDCQVYTGASAQSTATDSAVNATRGQCLYYNGTLVEAVYHSSDGGATEDAANVWGGDVGYLKGKKDPYEATISIPNYQYTVTYTSAELTYILQTKGYSIGTVADVYVSARTNMGNVLQVTFVDTAGKSLTVSRETCRTVFYSSTYGKSVRSMRFDISGGSGGTGSSGTWYINSSSNPLTSLDGMYTISGSGTVSPWSGTTPYVITSSGTSALGSSASSKASSGSSGTFAITGTGSGHNVGMSQYGASAMAQQGFSYLDILNFYYTGVTIG